MADKSIILMSDISEVMKLSEPKKMGRPTEKPKTTRITVRLDEESTAKLDKYCKQHKIERAEGVRRGIGKLEVDE